MGCGGWQMCSMGRELAQLAGSKGCLRAGTEAGPKRMSHPMKAGAVPRKMRNHPKKAVVHPKRNRYPKRRNRPRMAKSHQSCPIEARVPQILPERQLR